MVLYLNQIMREREVFLKKIGKIFLIILTLKVFFLFPNNQILSNENKVLEYFNNINEFSSLFLQISDGELSEGRLYYRDNRLRVDYDKPSNILIILAKNKAMYFNKDLNELEYFNPKKTAAKVFFDIFNKKNYFIDSKFINEKNFIKIKKEISLNKDEKFELVLVFEKNPTIIRNIKIINQDNSWEYSLLNHNFNPELSSDFFSMANPL